MSSRQQRLIRTVVLGAVAVAAGIAWLAVELGMDRQVLLDYAWSSLQMVLGLVALALGGAAVLRLIRRLTRRR